MSDFNISGPQNHAANLGGQCTIEYCSIDQIETWPKVIDGIVQSDIVLKTGESFYQAQFRAGSDRFEERPARSADGTTYNPKWSGTVSKGLPTRESKFILMAQKKWVVICEDRNGQQRVFGSPDRPAAFNWNYENTATKNAYRISFQAASDAPALFTSGIETDPPPTGCAPATVINTEGTTLGAPASGSVFTAPDGVVKNTVADLLASVPSGAEEILPDITVTDVDGSTRLVPAGKNVACIAPPGSKLHNEYWEFIGALLELTWNVPAGSTYDFDSIDTMTNADTVVIERDGIAVLVPFTATAGQEIKVTITKSVGMESDDSQVVISGTWI